MVECSPATRAARVRFPDDASFYFVWKPGKTWIKKRLGGAGYRSRYLSHAKRALYHLSYAPSMLTMDGFTNLFRINIFSRFFWWVILFGDVQVENRENQFSWRHILRLIITFTSWLKTVSPSIAQLVERWTVVVHCQTSIGRWFKSGSKDFFYFNFLPQNWHMTEVSVNAAILFF